MGVLYFELRHLFDTSRQTLHRWLKRARHVGREYFKDKPRTPRSRKATGEVEVSIFALRNTLKWGTARIQQGLLNLPDFIKKSIHCAQKIQLSRETINNVLTEHGINGYQRDHKRWKFFRAKEHDELWQIDFKGPFTVQGKKHWFLACIDDYNRFLVLAEQFCREPKTEEVTALLEKQKRHPKAILSDHGPQFKEKWKMWCKQHGVETHFAYPSLSSR